MKQPKFKNYLRKLQIRVPDAFMGPADFCQPSKDEKEGNSRLAATQNTTTGKSVSSHSLSQTKRYKRAEGAEGAKYIFIFEYVQICCFSKFIVFSIDIVIFVFCSRVDLVFLIFVKQIRSEVSVQLRAPRSRYKHGHLHRPSTFSFRIYKTFIDFGMIPIKFMK